VLRPPVHDSQSTAANAELAANKPHARKRAPDPVSANTNFAQATTHSGFNQPRRAGQNTGNKPPRAGSTQPPPPPAPCPSAGLHANFTTPVPGHNIRPENSIRTERQISRPQAKAAGPTRPLDQVAPGLRSVADRNLPATEAQTTRSYRRVRYYPPAVDTRGTRWKIISGPTRPPPRQNQKKPLHANADQRVSAEHTTLILRRTTIPG